MTEQAVSSPPTLVGVNPDNFKLNALFFRRLASLLKPYWLRREAWSSWVMFAIILSVGSVYTLAGGMTSYYTAKQTNSLLAKDVGAYWGYWGLVCAFVAMRFAMLNVGNYFEVVLELNWRTWLSTHLIDRYLRSRTYYRINIDRDLDNPDQRIQEGVYPFVNVMTSLPQRLMTATVDIGVQVVILMSISPAMFWATLVYVVVMTVATLRIYRPMIRQEWNSTIAEADFRYGLLHVRDNAETIAFYEGENSESRHLLARLKIAVARRRTARLYEIVTNIFNQSTGFLWDVLPMILVAPLFFTGKIEFGQIAQATTAAIMLKQSLNLISNFIPILSRAAPNSVRLAEIQEKFDKVDQVLRDEEGAAATSRITLRRNSDSIRLTDVTLRTPWGERNLIQNLSLTVPMGSHMLICGQTGVGKSSLLRAIAGLWTAGSGTIEAPAPGEALFLPQSPYMVLGDLRSQLEYPRENTSYTDSELEAVLERVRLGGLSARHGGLGVVRDWERLLSLGEQQRIGFARVLVTRPRFVFLDEATSAVDLDTEAHLYGLLVETGATIISVAHRTSLLRYHDLVLDLREDGCSLRRLNDAPPAAEPDLQFSANAR
jgi:vitamin B12/bleomycin/antimicrobial peptide transport system ATP-binding/permease protein